MEEVLDKIPLEALSEKVQRHVDLNAPAELKMMAAKMRVPMKPQEIITSLVFLLTDPDERLQNAARESLQNIPENILLAISREPLHPVVMYRCAEFFSQHPQVAENIILNPATPNEAIYLLSTRLKSRELDLIAQNQERILKYPKIIKGLYLNKEARMSTVNRVIEFAVRNQIMLDEIPVFKEIEAAIKGGERFDTEPSRDNAFYQATSQIKESEEPDPDELLAEKAAADLKKKDLRIYISTLNIAEKIRMAQLGGPSERSILIRDPNKIVALASIKSPKVSEREIYLYSQNRVLHEDVIRYIANNRDWVKKYGVKLNLVNNPKTPLAISMNLLPHLRSNDLKFLAKNKNIASALRTQAKNVLIRFGKSGA